MLQKSQKVMQSNSRCISRASAMLQTPHLFMFLCHRGIEFCAFKFKRFFRHTTNSFPTIVTQDTRKWTKLWARFGWRALFTSHAQQLTVLIRNYQFPLTFRDPVQDRCCPQFFSSLLSSFYPLALLTHPFLSWLQPPCSLLLPFIFFPFSFYGLCTTGCGKLRIDTLHTKVGGKRKGIAKQIIFILW